MFEPQNILAVDPGKATGCALWRPREGHLSWTTEGGIVGFAQEFPWWLEEYNIDMVVIEKFTIGAKSGVMTSQYDAVYINGFVLGYAECDDVGYGLKQQPVTMVKTFATDVKLKKLGWYEGAPGHSDDASRHLLTYMSGIPAGQELLERLI